MRIVSLMLFLGLVTPGIAQENRLDSLSGHEESGRKLGYDLEKGKFDFHVRSFLMSTHNRGDLLDYSALGVGAGLGYLSPEYRGFQVGFSGFFVFQLFENNIAVADPTTGAGNRYEILLFDMHDPENMTDLDRLEEFFISYKNGNFRTVFGRQKINSPFLNEQDNRMRPNIFSGLTVNYQKSNWETTASWLSAVTIRGTVDWFSMEESFGVYPFGRNPFGEPSNYSHNISSKGMGMFGLKYRNEDFSAQGWNYFAENVFNMSFLQGDYVLHLGHASVDLGGQGFFQTAVNDGGNSEIEKTYMLPDEKSFGFGGKIGLNSGRHHISANFLGINDRGRFLFPREWGRENFYASMSRERYEGSGDMDALVFKYSYDTPFKGLNAQLGAGKVNHGGLDSFKTNKYGIPSYYHFTGLFDYRFSNYLEGLDIQFMVAQKTAQKPSEVPDMFRINRVDMWNLNFIIDYRF
ncbi:hypothetical protein MMU07_12225 [Aquiflexum sp. LQ15W]|uniref:hypothetical protein n=1 Tax=Cognataquiflexum nitidum TaxID=2922272 RepID=UPI001F13B419|nr:hypothetical protein [Cognataquiflexum nitidum]MCH6200349.1 hypothetical protein [Cognataquiflexum nitidum]